MRTVRKVVRRASFISVYKIREDVVTEVQAIYLLVSALNSVLYCTAVTCNQANNESTCVS